LKLSVRWPSGREKLVVEKSSSLHALQETICTMTQIPAKRQRLLCGFPPAPIVADGSAALSELSLMSGDMVTVEETAAEESPPNQDLQKAEASKQLGPDVCASCLDGQLVKRVVDADNSCLFNSIGYVLQNKNRQAATELREIVAQAIASATEEYSEAVLGRPNGEYCTWIRSSQSWGGEIELSILTKHFQTEIDVISIANLHLYRYGEGAGYNSRALLLYDGIHYDALALQPTPDADEDFDKTVFDVATEGSVIDGALTIAKAAKEARAFTDTGKFLLRCLVCQCGLTGEKDAVEHAKSTGHQNFAEY